MTQALSVDKIFQLIKEHHASLRVPGNVESKIIVPKRRHIVDDLLDNDVSTPKRGRVHDGDAPMETG